MSIAAHFLCVCLSACLCVWCVCLWRADGGSGHTCCDIEAIEPPHPTTTNYHRLLSPLHKRPLTTSDPTGIHSDWLKVLAVARQEQCSVVSERKRREGGVCRHAWRGGKGGEKFSTSCPPFIQTQKPSGVTTSQEQTGSLFFHLESKGIGHGSEKIQPLTT